MKIRYAICLALSVTGLAALAGPTSAQVLMPPYEITTSVRSMGLEPISQPIRRGPRYVLRAIDGRGAVVTVAADAMTGRILAVRPMGNEPQYRNEAAPAYAGRTYPYYRDDTVPYRPGEIAPPRGIYQGPPIVPDPKVIPAPRDNASAAPPVARPPSVAKPPVPRVAGKPPVQPAPPAEAKPPADNATNATGSTPPSPAAKNSALAIPPVQSFE